MQKRYPESQKRANDRWRKKNPAQSRYLSYRGTAKMFCKRAGKIEDLEMLAEIIDERIKREKNVK